MTLKTSEQWAAIHRESTGQIVMDPDGWDRKNYEYSWHKEEISHEEFMKRLESSTTVTIAAQTKAQRDRL